MRRLIFVIVLAQMMVSHGALSQEENDRKMVFLDCNARNCDFDHFRRQVPWVSWVRDRKDGDIHLLITDQRTGGGGREYTLDYIVEEQSVKTIVFQTDPNDTDTEVRNQLTNRIAIGLIQFVEESPVADDILISFDGEEEPVVLDQEADPWNLWVFRFEVGGSMEAEAFQSAYTIYGEMNINRVTEDFKIVFEGDAFYNEQEFNDTDSDATVVNTQEFYSLEGLAVWSLTDKWSSGLGGEIVRSTFRNLDMGIFIGPAVEYNIFPYSESTRKAFIFRYRAELASFDYELTTVEGMDQEMLGRHSLRAEAAIQQPWGEIFAYVEGIQYFHDPATHRINTLIRLEYRLFRGFNIDIFARYSRIKDQFYLPAEGLSPEEILLRRRQRETDFRYDIGMGFSYRFGSKYANVVNPRLD